MQPIILAGGVGKRLWPISTEKLPKQFIKFDLSNLSFFQKTLLRVKRYKRPIIIGNYAHKNLIYKQMAEIGINGIVALEEKISGTYIPILYGLALSEHIGNNIAGIFPTDHFIDMIEDFHSDIDIAINLTASNEIVTFGKSATFIDKNYGHIISKKLHDNVYQAQKFIEKPSSNCSILSDITENCFWNLGIFIVKTSLLKNLLGDDFNIINSYIKNFDCRKSPMGISKDLYKFFYNSSFDMIVMNKLENFYMIDAKFIWLDIGSLKNIFLYLINYSSS